MKKYILGLIIFIFSLSYLNVWAYDPCTDKELNRLTELANNVQFKTRYEVTPHEETIDGKVYKTVSLVYGIDIINFNKDLRVGYIDNGEKNIINFKTKKIENLAEGSTINLTIYAYTTNLCTETVLKNVKVDLPDYNDYYYYNKEKCEAEPNFKYCKEFMDVSDISFEEIDKLYEEYTKPAPIVTEPKKDMKKWYIIGGAAVLFVLLVTIILVINKKKRTNDDL